MQEDNRTTCVGVVRFKIEINYTRRECNAFSRPKLDFEIRQAILPHLRRDPAVLRVAGRESAGLLVHPT
jgi:hypothetical protein